MLMSILKRCKEFIAKNIISARTWVGYCKKIYAILL